MTGRPNTIEALVADIGRRVRPVVARMPQHEFVGLVRRMAELELRYAPGTPSLQFAAARRPAVGSRP